jgi:hypothetical protein
MSEQGTKMVTTSNGLVVHPVQFGRDARRRPFRRSLLPPWRKRYQCVCCGAYTLDSVDWCDICSRCGWEDWHEYNDAPDQCLRPNYVSLNTLRSVIQRFGYGAACHVNRARGLTVADLEAMSQAQLATLRTYEEEDQHSRRHAARSAGRTSKRTSPEP